MESQEQLLEEIMLDFNIDELPISKSTSSGFWLILASAYNIPECRIIVIGIFHGNNKLTQFFLILKPFLDELKLLMEDYNFNGTEIIKIRSFILDALKLKLNTNDTV